jgi:hypothetical protein
MSTGRIKMSRFTFTKLAFAGAMAFGVLAASPAWSA